MEDVLKAERTKDNGAPLLGGAGVGSLLGEELVPHPPAELYCALS